MEKAITKTEDFLLFEQNLNQRINTWQSNKKYPKKRGVLSRVISQNNSFYLWGEPGSGKTEYLNLWKCKKMYKIITANKVSDIKDEGIYLLDGVNEIVDYSEDKIEKLLKNIKIFIIFAGWDRSQKYYGHNISPSLEIINKKGWEAIAHCYWTEPFSIREKFLMCNNKLLNRIKEKEFHSLIWKSFENIMTYNEKEWYKKMVNKNPLFIEDTTSTSFQSLLKKKIVQFNRKLGVYIFSHQNIVSYLFFRNHIEAIKDLNFKSTKIDIIKIIKSEPTQFIYWWLSLNKRENINNNKLLTFFKKNNIKISVFDHQLIDQKLKNNFVNYLPLKFNDLCILANNKKYQRMYEEYLKENINNSEELNKTHLNQKDIGYFIYSILSPLRGDDYYPSIMNSMRPTNFYHSIKWNNSNNRYKMLNFILGRYIQGYLDETFSALKISRLENKLYSKWDSENKFSFYDFVKMCWDSIEEKYKTKSTEKVENFDAVLNCGKGRSYILDASCRYGDIDKRFTTSRNAQESDIFSIGHRRVNLYMYLLFEKDTNEISNEEQNKYYVNQYSGGLFHQGTDITDPFQKFCILFLKRYVYYFNNMPVEKKIFNPNIEMLSSQVESLLLKNHINKFKKEIRKYLENNSNLLELKWELDKYKGKGGFNYIWISNYEKYWIYESESIKDKVYYCNNSSYDEQGMQYIRKNNQYILLSKTRKFKKFIISYKLDGENGELLDSSFILDLENEKIPKNIRYKDITAWTLNDDFDDIESLYENEILPLIKKNFTIKK